MAPDRPDASDVETGVGATDTGPVVTRVFGFCDAFSMKEEDGGGGGSGDGGGNGGGVVVVDDHHHHEQFVEETTVGHDEEIVIEEEEVPMIKPEPGDEKPGSGQSDDDLTSLSWLHQQNLLKGLEITDHPVKTIKEENILNNNVICEDSLDISENTNSVSSLDESYSPESNGKNGSVGSGHFLNYDDVVINGVASPSKNTQECAKSPNGTPVAQTNNNQVNNNNINNNNNNSNNSANFNLPVPNRNKHPTHIPYDPYLHKNSKPPYSFSCLIFMAIEDSPVKALPVKEVYAWILEHFPYFRNAPTGWKNSVRHNLSLNKCFRKVEKSPNLGKGSLWMVDAQYRPNLIQALSRSPFPPPTAANITAGANGTTAGATGPEKQPRTKPNGRLPDPRLFPYLSRRLATTNAGENAEVEFDSDVDAAAAAMLSFKHGPIILNHHKDAKKKESNKMVPVITRSSTEDHTYSLITSVRLERRYAAADTTEDVDEQRKIAEGADALLNLAGVTTTPLRDPLAPDEDEAVDHNHVHESPLFTQYWQPEQRYIPGSDPLEIRPVTVTKRRTSASSGDGPASKRPRKRPWRDTWAENGGRFIKQVRG